MFAELFERAINANGLAAYPFQNPGRFLEEAANHFKSANLLIKNLKAKRDFVKAKSPAQDPLQNFGKFLFSFKNKFKKNFVLSGFYLKNYSFFFK